MTNAAGRRALDVAGTRLDVDQIDIPEELLTPELVHLYRHSSVRSFHRTPLKPGMLEAIVAAAVSASTSSNLHAYSIVAVEDQTTREKLAELAGKQRFIADAPLFLAFCPDIWRLQYLCRRQGRSYGTKFLDQFCIALGDTHLALQNAAVAAEALGLGICMVGGVRQAPWEIADLLGLPEGVYCAVGLCVGYPKSRSPVKPRLPLKVILHRERYSTERLEEGLREYDARMIAAKVYEGRQISTPADPPRPDPYGWCEHTSRRVSDADAVNPASGTRRYMRQFLLERGFHLD